MNQRIQFSFLLGVAFSLAASGAHAGNLSDADFNKLSAQHRSRVARLIETRAKAIDLFGAVRSCSPGDVARYFPGGAPVLTTGDKCAPTRARNAWTEMHVCLAREAARIEAFAANVERLKGHTSFWSRVTCRISGAWNAFKSSATRLKDSTVGFVRELGDCLGELGRLLTFQPATINDAALRSRAEQSLSLFDRLRRMTLDLDALSPANVVKECKVALSVARDVASKVAAALAAAARVVTTGASVIAGEAVCRNGAWGEAFCTIIEKGKACLAEAVRAGKRLPKAVRDELEKHASWWGKLKALPAAVAGVFKDTKVRDAANAAVAACKERLAEGAVALGEAACKQLGPTLGREISSFAGEVLSAVGRDLARITITKVGREIQQLLCSQDLGDDGLAEAAGQSIVDVAKKLGEPKFTITKITVELIGPYKAKLGATAKLSILSKPDALSFRLEGEISVKPGSCDFSGPMLMVTAKVTDTRVSQIPSWLTDRLTANFVNPSLGCFAICPAPIKAAGMPIEIDFCRVIDSCLKNRCTAPVVNTLLRQLFPISTPVVTLLPKDAALDPVWRDVRDWVVTLSRVVYKANEKHAYRPAVTARVSFGPPGKPKQIVDAIGSLDIRTHCRAPGKSMIKVTPSLKLKVGEVPAWLQKVPAHAFDTFWRGKTSREGKIPVLWGDLKTQIVAAMNAPSDASDRQALVKKLRDIYRRYGNRALAVANIKADIMSMIVGSLNVPTEECRQMRRRTAAAAASGGACAPCIKVGASSAGRTHGAERVAHVTGDNVNLRSAPTTEATKVGQLDRCAEVSVLAEKIRGGGREWTKIDRGASEAYIASQYLAPGPCEKARTRN